MVWYLPRKSSVTEDGLPTETGLEIKISVELTQIYDFHYIDEKKIISYNESIIYNLDYVFFFTKNNLNGSKRDLTVSCFTLYIKNIIIRDKQIEYKHM